jgi:hypothetical protein
MVLRIQVFQSEIVADQSPPKSVAGICSPPNGDVGDAGDRSPKSPPLSVDVEIENGVSTIMGEATVLAGNTGV